MKRVSLTVAMAALAGTFAASGAQAQVNHPTTAPQVHTNAVGSASATARPETATAQRAPDAKQLVTDATKVIESFDNHPDFRQLAEKAKGIFIIPHLVRGSLIVGGQGGEGVLLAHKGTKWSDPVFYNIGSISIGLQAGGAAGPVAFLLMTDKAVATFLQQNNFSLNGNAGLTITTWSQQAQGSVGKGDIVVYSDLSGLSGGVNINGTDIVFDGQETQNYYGHQVTAEQILGGQVQNPYSNMLTSRLPG